MNQIVESQNLEESSLAVRRMLTATGDCFREDNLKVQGRVVWLDSTIKYTLFYFSHPLVSSLIIAFCVILHLPLEVQKM